jgi:hypothetical protein
LFAAPVFIPWIRRLAISLSTSTVDHLIPCTEEGGHFYVCPTCGQAVDMRSLFQVFHHESEEHEPLTDADLSATATVAT